MCGVCKKPLFHCLNVTQLIHTVFILPLSPSKSSLVRKICNVYSQTILRKNRSRSIREKIIRTFRIIFDILFSRSFHIFIQGFRVQSWKHWSLQCRQRQSSQSLSWVSHYRFCKSGLEIGLSSSRICGIMHREEVEITWPAPFNPHDSRAIREVKAVDPGLAVWDPNSRKSSLRTTTLLPVLWRRSL